MRDRELESLVEKIVDELTRLRKAQKISHEKLAERTGMSRTAISFIESHKRTPTIFSCMRIAKALGVKFGDIVNNLDK